MASGGGIHRANVLSLGLIEILAVIPIVAILTAVAAPRAADLTDHARRAAFDRTRSAFQSSLILVHSAWLAGGQPDSVMRESGAMVALNRTGWPILASEIRGQQDARQLYETLLSMRLPSDWQASSPSRAPQAGGPEASASLTNQILTFVYDAETGRVTETVL